MDAFKKLKRAGISGTFLDDEKNPVFEDAEACVLGIAFDATASYGKGAFFGPQAIMEASHQIEWEAPAIGTALPKKLKTRFLGFLEYPAEKEWALEKIEQQTQKMVADVKQIASRVFKQKKFLIAFGGGHSTSNGIFQGITENVSPKDVTIIQLDAHLDLRDSYQGLKYSHATVMKRALDLGFPIIQIGIRDHISEEEAELIKSKRLAKKIFLCPTMPLPYYHQNGFGIWESENFLWKGHFSLEAIDKILWGITTKQAYLTIDVDAFDPAFFPGTGTPLPFGLNLASTQDFLHRLFFYLKKKNIELLGFDLQEVAPQRSPNTAEYNAEQAFSTQTEMNAALLAYKLLLWQFLERFKQ